MLSKFAKSFALSKKPFDAKYADALSSEELTFLPGSTDGLVLGWSNLTLTAAIAGWNEQMRIGRCHR